MSVKVRVIARVLRAAACAAGTGGPRPLALVVLDINPVGLA
jgi:hypothetical protein